MKHFFILFLMAYGLNAFSQDFEWWNVKHNWDGKSHYSEYLTFSPACLGPNALPVPEFNTGEIPESSYFKVASEAHLSNGDNTYNLFTKAFFSFANNRIGIEVYGVPLEYYKMDTLTRDARAARDIDPRGWANGDLYFGTTIQLMKKRKRLPDITLRMNCKTASGNNKENARYTDNPGYFFDLAFGKDIPLANKNRSIRPFGLVGLYVWQTNRIDYFQNDAFLYALGTVLKIKDLEISQSWGGYMGYIGNGDSPMVIRTSIRDTAPGLGYHFQFQQGLQDFYYTSLSLGLQYNFSKIN